MSELYIFMFKCYFHQWKLNFSWSVWMFKGWNMILFSKVWFIPETLMQQWRRILDRSRSSWFSLSNLGFIEGGGAGAEEWIFIVHLSENTNIEIFTKGTKSNNLKTTTFSLWNKRDAVTKTDSLQYFTLKPVPVLKGGALKGGGRAAPSVWTNQRLSQQQVSECHMTTSPSEGSDCESRDQRRRGSWELCLQDYRPRPPLGGPLGAGPPLLRTGPGPPGPHPPRPPLPGGP